METGTAFGFLDPGGSWFYKHTNDTKHEWFDADEIRMTLTGNNLDVEGEIQSGSTIVAGGAIRTDTNTNYALLTGYSWRFTELKVVEIRCSWNRILTRKRWVTSYYYTGMVKLMETMDF